MSKKTKRNSSSPFAAVDGVWKRLHNGGLSSIYRRVFLAQTLTGLLHAFFESARMGVMENGLAHIPEKLVSSITSWPSSSTPLGKGLLVGYPTDGGIWMSQGEPFLPVSSLGKELWLAWAGEKGCLLVVAKKMQSRKKLKVNLDDMWQVRISWEAGAVQLGLDSLKAVFEDSSYLKEHLVDIENSLAKSDFSEEIERDAVSPVRSGLAMADSLDPWTQNQLNENNWSTVKNRIQGAVSGELRSERLLPALGTALQSSLGYDYIEVHIFTRVGSRYEEFLSWRKNNTGYGGERMTILLGEQLVSSVLKEKKPRIIQTQRVDGVMNPHLAQLSGLTHGIVLPLIHGKKVQGLMMLFYRGSLNLEAYDLERVDDIGKIIARSIEASNAHGKLQKMATLDGLTNIYNRRFFNEQIKREFKRAKRYNSDLALIIIDIDYFKKFNDSHGHLTGDRILRQLALILKESVREEDTVARYGGEEFVIILPENDEQAGMVVAEKIRSTINTTNFPKGDEQPLGRMTISLGVAAMNETVQSPRDLINRSDQALYHAKNNGRDRTMTYTIHLDSVS